MMSLIIKVISKVTVIFPFLSRYGNITVTFDITFNDELIYEKKTISNYCDITVIIQLIKEEVLKIKNAYEASLSPEFPLEVSI